MYVSSPDQTTCSTKHRNYQLFSPRLAFLMQIESGLSIRSNVKDITGPHFVDDEQTYGTEEKCHDGSTAYSQLLEDGSCTKPLQGACASRDSKKNAYLEGPIDRGGNGWYCRICNEEEKDGQTSI